jgi:hypothetical protein
VSIEVQNFEWLSSLTIERNNDLDKTVAVSLVHAPPDLRAWVDPEFPPAIEDWVNELFDTYETYDRKHREDPDEFIDPWGEVGEKQTKQTQKDVDTPTGDLLKFIESLKHDVAHYLSTRTGLRGRINALRAGLEDPDEPSGPYYTYVDQVVPEGVSDEFRDKLARRLFEAWDDLEDRIDEKLSTFNEGELVKRTNARCDLPGFEIIWEAENTIWPDDSMYWADQVALEWLAKWTDLIDDLESSFEKARQRWSNWRDGGNIRHLFALWADPGTPIPLHLWPVKKVAEHLWERKIRPQWERLRDNRPAVVRSVHDDLEEMAFHKGRTVRGKNNDSQLELWNEGDDLVAQTPTLPEQQLARVVEQGTEEFRSITGVRLLVHVIRTTHMQFYRDADDPRVVEVEGGIKELSRQIGDPGSGKSQDRLKKILEAGNHWRREWNGVVERGLWTWSVDDRTGPGQRSHVRIIVGDPLSPQFAHQMPKGERTLVPIVDIAPLVNPGRYYGPQAAFQQALVRKIVERRKHIPERGGATLSLIDDLWPMADRLNLPQSTMKRALDRWTSDGNDGPQFLELVDGQIEGQAVYHLGDNEKYRRAREFVAETARRSKRASEAGKASANKRKNR